MTYRLDEASATLVGNDEAALVTPDGTFMVLQTNADVPGSNHGSIGISFAVVRVAG